MFAVLLSTLIALAHFFAHACFRRYWFDQRRLLLWLCQKEAKLKFCLGNYTCIGSFGSSCLPCCLPGSRLSSSNITPACRLLLLSPNNILERKRDHKMLAAVFTAALVRSAMGQTCPPSYEVDDSSYSLSQYGEDRGLCTNACNVAGYCCTLGSGGCNAVPCNTGYHIAWWTGSVEE